MNPAPLPTPYARACWCGDHRQFAWSPDYNVCLVCGTLISRAAHAPGALEVKADAGELYSKDYWLKRQQENFALPPIQQRARSDLPERCLHWLRLLLCRKLPGPGIKILELGCAHGGFVALMQWAGYAAAGIEMSPWVVDFARTTFGIEVYQGPLEQQSRWSEETFDAIILNDVIEHLPNPLGTLSCAARLLKSDGIVFIQTPEYKEHLSYADLVAAGDDHTRPLHGKNEEHLFLYSRRATQMLWSRLGFQHFEYIPALFPYDMSYMVSRQPLSLQTDADIADALARIPSGRMVRALLDKDTECIGLRGLLEQLRKTDARHR